MKKYSFDYDWYKSCENRKTVREDTVDISAKNSHKPEIRGDTIAGKNCVGSKKVLDGSFLNIQNCGQFDENCTSRDICTIEDAEDKEYLCNHVQEPSYTCNRFKGKFECCKTCVFYDDISGDCCFT